MWYFSHVFVSFLFRAAEKENSPETCKRAKLQDDSAD